MIGLVASQSLQEASSNAIKTNTNHFIFFSHFYALV